MREARENARTAAVLAPVMADGLACGTAQERVFCIWPMVLGRCRGVRDDARSEQHRLRSVRMTAIATPGNMKRLRMSAGGLSAAPVSLGRGWLRCDRGPCRWPGAGARAADRGPRPSAAGTAAD